MISIRQIERSLGREFETSEQLLFSEYCDVKNIMNRSDASALMHYYLKELHLDIDKLKYIHVTGSKGKGTTCTYIEKALRLHGLKTGNLFYRNIIDRSLHLTSHSIHL